MKQQLPVSFLAILLVAFVSACSAPQDTTSVSDSTQNPPAIVETTTPDATPSDTNSSKASASSDSTKPTATSAPTATSPTAPTPTTSTTSTAPAEPEKTAPIISTPVVQVIADGTYTESGTYQSPAQTENVSFSFTVKSGTITGVNLVSTSSVQASQKYQGLFTTGIKDMVVGKKLSDIGTFDRVNGSSLTSKGFNQALGKLKQKA